MKTLLETDGRQYGKAPPRRARQERAKARCRIIAEAASRVIADRGVAGLTHRHVAKEAGIPLAATTYHFATKADIIHAATLITQRSLDLSFKRAGERFANAGSDDAFFNYFNSLIRSIAGRGRPRALAWGEVMLDAPRHPAGVATNRDWFAGTTDIWEKILDECGVERPRDRAVTSIDILVGLLFLTVGLGLTERQVVGIFAEGADLLEFRPDAIARPEGEALNARTGTKAATTRARILASTIDILKAEGPGAVSSRTVSDAAGVTKAAPFYHFPTVADLLAAAQHLLFDQSKARYRLGLADFGRTDPDLERLVDRTATVFLREATEFASESVAHYSIWLRADQQEAVRAMTWEAAADQHNSWRSVIRKWKPNVRPSDPLLCQALFIGKLVRTLATGSRIDDLAAVRREFASGLGDIFESHHLGN